ncbi:hypothetical protein CMI37_09715 [Candidatus Pacearchaeota archaeon]|nr:hypothetical protein [Candidatus Pacearchaeota archaeon]|tara:strand:+ start:8656 stop:9750 length:1095 start_codon:yes stop_codon:yes gene_type:complete
MSEIALTKEQQENILNEWNSRPNKPPSLLELIRAAYPNQNVDGRSREGKAVKAFLATREIKAHGSHEYQPKQKIDLTEEHKEFVRNNFSMMSSVEMARILFAEPELTNLNQESRAIVQYVESLNPAIAHAAQTELLPDIEKYEPPKTLPATILKVNRYVHEGINKAKLSINQKNGLNALIGYLHTFRFQHQIGTYRNETDRELFESSFVRYTFDKPDLSQEEVDQYIVLSTEVVISNNIQRRVERLQELLDGTANDTEGRRISMSLVESIDTSHKEYNQCVNRQQKLLESLKEKRSDKLKKQISENASVLNLVQMWREEESRQKMIKLAEIRKKTLKKEIENLSTMDEMKAKVMGISKDEVLDG